MLAAAVLVLAAGYYVPETGTAARARGGAHAAMSGDPLQMIFNPAGLVGAERQVLVDATSLWQWETFRRTDIAPDSTAGATATNRPAPQIVPNLVYVHPVGERLVLAAGFHAPAGPRYRFEDRGPQRYSVSRLDLVEASYGVAVAWRAASWVAVGLEVEGMLHGVRHRLYVTQNTSPPPTEAEAADAVQELDVLDPFTPNVRLGVLLTPMQGLDVGLSWRPSTDVSAGGELSSPSLPEPEKVRFAFATASVLRAGVRWSRPTWDVEADVVVEDWSRHRVQTLTATDGGFLDTDEVEVPREFGTSVGVRLGGSWAARPDLRVLGGWFFEPSAVPDAHLDAGSYDADKHGVSVGGSWKKGRFTVTGAYTHVFLATRTITDSENRQQSVLASAPEEARSVISNGRYSGSYDMLGASLATRF